MPWSVEMYIFEEPYQFAEPHEHVALARFLEAREPHGLQGLRCAVETALQMSVRVFPAGVFSVPDDGRLRGAGPGKNREVRARELHTPGHFSEKMRRGR